MMLIHNILLIIFCVTIVLFAVFVGWVISEIIIKVEYASWRKRMRKEEGMNLRFWESPKRRKRREFLLGQFAKRHGRLIKFFAEKENLTMKESRVFVDRILLVICQAKGPVVHSDFTPHFMLAEGYWVDVVLYLMSHRFNMVKREVRWSLR